MAQDATGPPTGLGIPTYNPDGDSPSGKGFNAAMAAIDALIAARAPAPSGATPAGEFLRWSGSAFTSAAPTSVGLGLVVALGG